MVAAKRKGSSSVTMPPKETSSGLIGSVIRGLLLLNISFTVNILNAIVYLAVRPWSRLTARRLIGGICQSLWQKAVARILPSADIVVSGQCEPDTSRPAIIICNHQVDADWWYIWEFARLLNMHGRLKIILKADLRNIPVIGWGMRQFEFLFLHRNWQSDKQSLYNHLGSFTEDGYPCCVLIFPEGTTINTRTLEKSQQFAKERERPMLRHLLLPRTTGFAACLDALSWSGVKPIIYDLTLAYSGYSGEVPTWEMGYNRNVDVTVPNVGGMLRGYTCPRVHVHVKRYDATEEMLDNTERWLDARWKEKDERLQKFIEKQSFQEADAAGGMSPPLVAHPRGSMFYLMLLLILPSIMLLCLPLLILVALFVSPAIVLAGTVQFVRDAFNRALKGGNGAKRQGKVGTRGARRAILMNNGSPARPNPNKSPLTPIQGVIAGLVSPKRS